MNYTIENDLLKVEVNSKGAELSSIKDKANLKEHLWKADPKVWARHSPVLFPIEGKLKNNECIIEDKKYNMTQHGFARDMQFKMIEQLSNKIKFSLSYDKETLKKYPYKFVLEIEYELNDNKIDVIYRVKNINENEMYFSIGAHPGFTCPLNEEEKYEDYYLEFNCKETAYKYLLTEDGLLTEEKEIILDNSDKINISRQLFKEDALVFKNIKSDSISIKNKEGKSIVTVEFKGFPYLGIWAPYDENANFVCIEPWYGLPDNKDSNGDFKNKEGIIKLKAKENFQSKYTITL